MPRRLPWIEPAVPPVGEAALHDDPLLALLLRGRVDSPAAAAAFLSDDQRPAPDPMAVPGMADGVARIAAALRHGEPIAVFGDYDVDGVTAAAIVAEALAAAGAEPTVVLPTRADGYGLNEAAVRRLAAGGARLLIAVDCGSCDHAAVGVARALGIDVVAIDHHQMPGPGPDGAIVVSPQAQPGAPYRELSAAGLAYLAAAALAESFDLGRGRGREPRHLLDLVALGLVADVSPLTGVNRPLVRDGLRWLRQARRPGIAALCQNAGIAPDGLTSWSIGFKLAPRLNAAGRMDDPRIALDLLRAPDSATAARLSSALERLNGERKVEADAVVAEAEVLLRARPDLASRPALVVAGPAWRSGVLGLAATRLADRYRRPVVVLSDDGTTSRGSARSVPGFDIAAALAACGDLLDHHGGHSQAAGLSLPSSSVGRLATSLESLVAAAGVAPRGPELRLAADLPGERADLATADLIAALEPFGAGNEPPLLRLVGARLVAYDAIGADRRHLKLLLETPAGRLEALAWGEAARSRELVGRRRIDLVGRLEANAWNGRRRAQFVASDFDAR